MELSNNDFNYEITNDRGFSNYSKLIGHIRQSKSVEISIRFNLHRSYLISYKHDGLACTDTIRSALYSTTRTGTDISLHGPALWFGSRARSTAGDSHQVLLKSCCRNGHASLGFQVWKIRNILKLSLLLIEKILSIKQRPPNHQIQVTVDGTHRPRSELLMGPKSSRVASTDAVLACLQ